MVAEIKTTAVFNPGVFSTFCERVKNQISIDDMDFRLLRKLDTRRIEFAPRSTLMTDGGPAPHLFVVAAGWLFAHTSLPNGGRYIHRVFQPGDLIGTEDINWTFSTSTVTSATRCVVGRFSKDQYLELFSNTTRLGAALHAIAMTDQVVLIDMARANTRLDGMGRLAHLLLAIEARQLLTTDNPAGSPFHMPLTQAVLADTCGLSLVHTNKELRRLQESGFIEQSDNHIRIVRREELLERTGFQGRYNSSRPEWIERLTG